jgi:predicted nucleotidyltransferase
MTFEKFKLAYQVTRQQQKLNHQARKAMVVARAKPIFERFGIRQAVLFGSLVQGNSSEHSDVDLLVTPLAAAHYWEFRHVLERALELPVDIYTQDDEPQFVAKVLERGEVIYVA